VRVLMLTTSYPTHRTPTLGVFIRDHAEALAAAGHDVTVLAPRLFSDDPLLERDGDVTVRRFRFWSAQHLLGEYERIPVLRVATLLVSGLAAAVWIGRRERCDVLHGHWVIPTGLIALLAGRYLLRRPVVVTAHRADIVLATEGSRIAHFLTGFTLRHVDATIAVSEELEEIIVSEFSAPAASVHRWPVGANTRIFVPGDRVLAREQEGLAADVPLALFVGDLTERKGIPFLVEAIPQVLATVPDARFVLAGGGPLTDFVHDRLVTEIAAGSVTVLGGVPHEKLPRWMDAADVLVLPSWSEGLPVCLMEAAAVGLPVVTTRVGGSAEVAALNPRSSVVDPGDVCDLVDALARALAHPQPGRREPDLEPESLFDQRGVIGRIEALYEALASRKTGR